MIEIRIITSEKEIEKFIDFRTELYKDDPCAVPYLFMGEQDDLDKKKNPAFKFCEAEYYMAYRDGKAVGRIAAIINHRANETWQHKCVRFGYFDFIDDKEVSKALLETVMDYGRQRGMQEIIGPMGFIDLDREGMLVEGFDVTATMHANHNYPYYKDHMEALGFTKDNDWVQDLVTVPEKVPEKFEKIANMISKRYNLHARKFTKREAYSGMGKKVFQLMNKCYEGLYEYAELDDEHIEYLVKNYIGFADMNLITLIVDGDKNDEIVGFGVTFPSFSKALRRTKNGKLLPFGWFHLLRTLLFHDTDTVDLLIIGVLPEYRAKGANAILFNDLIRWYNKYHFKQALTLAMMETNDGVLSAWQYLDSHTVKRLRSYKKQL